MYMVAYLPFRLQMGLGAIIGRCALYLAVERRRICEVNIALCFPELSPEEQSPLVRNTFASVGALKRLKTGHTLWCAPDQDYGARHSVYAKFFGVTAATISATSKFARFGDAEVIFFSHYRRADNSGYVLEFTPLVDEYPTGDDVTDAQLINDLIETAIRKRPEQYLWLHRRFKTQPGGKSASPYRNNLKPVV